jgi:O-antigen/teichoic acid export membrane protein
LEQVGELMSNRQTLQAAGQLPGRPAHKGWGVSIARNSVLTVTGQFVPAAAALVSMPVLARHLGHDRLGLLTLLWIAIGYFSLLDLGMSVAVTRAVAQVVAIGDDHRVPPIFWSGVFSQLTMGVLGAIVLAAASPYAVGPFLHIPKALSGEARSALMIGAMGIPFSMASYSTIGLLQAVQRFDITTRIQAPLGAAQYLLAALCSLWRPNLALIVLILVAARCAGLVLLYNAARRLFPVLHRSMKFHRKEFASLFKFGGWITVTSVISPMQVYADRFVIGGVLSLSAVAYYSVPLDASLRILVIPCTLMIAAFPTLSAARPCDLEAVIALAAKLVRWMFFILAVPITAGIIFSADIMRFWMGPVFAAQSAPVLSILLVGILANSFARVPLSVLNAAGRPDVAAKLQLAEFPVQIAATVLLLHVYGLPGAALAWTSRLLVDTALLFIIAKRATGLRLCDVLGVRLRAGMGGLALMGLATAAAAQMTKTPSLKLASALALVLTGFLGAWSCCLTSRDRRGLLEEMSRITGSWR